MDRRLFLNQSTRVALTAALLPAIACQTTPGKPVTDVPTGTPGTEETAPASAADNFELQELTVTDLQDRMAKGTETARSLSEKYLARIKALNEAGPMLRAVIETNPDALTIADGLDQERKAGKLRGPLHGIPVLIKDNIDSGDQMMTTAGASALIGHKAKQDAFIVQKLRAAGAVLLGKTNLSEWANFRSSHSVSGWSSRGRQSRNPYVLDRSTSGSSSGSGAAVAANLCAVAIGTETDGSVVSPSSCNGLVGLKPTVGLLSRSGIIPISSTQDTAGPMARTVRDAAILLSALAGPDPADPAKLPIPKGALTDYTTFLKSDALQGQRLGVEKAHLNGPPAVAALLRQAVAALKARGATIVEVELNKLVNPLGEAEFDVLLYEFKAGVNAYLANAGATVKNLADVIAYNKAHAAEAMPFFQQETLIRAEATDGLNNAKYKAAVQQTVAGARQAIDGLLKTHQLAAIIGVTTGPAWCIDWANGDYSTGVDFSSPAAMAGYPHLTVPMGQVLGLPVGLSFVGSAYHERLLLALGYAYEQATHKREAPKMLPTVHA
ncbi:amidase [Microvirga sp. STS02]|uniref:amidase n=1 Tax=Hymenobacter negativus TaxID=2795026 RepID=UPI0018DB3052|nr:MULTISPECIES: amidase [Bacteria]MBH8567850.1 amidase [Hymenobacter negativus]MBR7207586.1 amidase [Microvirga sp. STS02]